MPDCFPSEEVTRQRTLDLALVYNQELSVMKKNEEKKIKLSNHSISYTVRISDRAKYLRLSISMKNGLEVIVPKGQGNIDIEPFLKKKSSWIIEKLEHLKKIDDQGKSRIIRENSKILYLGEQFSLKNNPALLTGQISKNEQTVYVNLDALKQSGNYQGCLRLLFEAWYKDQAKLIISARVDYYKVIIGVQINKISIKNQKSRWGSSSSLKNLNFNWKLIMAPMEIIDYLVIHELAHQKVPNHSKYFWEVVKYYCSDYKDHEQWLKQNGHKLIL